MKPHHKINFNIGDIITITEWIDRMDRSWIGDPLLVTAIDGEFFVVKHLKNLDMYSPINLSVHNVDTRVLEKAYVEAQLSASTLARIIWKDDSKKEKTLVIDGKEVSESTLKAALQAYFA